MLIASVAFAGAVYAQTTNTTSNMTTMSATSSSTSSSNGPLGPFLVSSLGTPNQNKNLTVCQDRAARHELITWYNQLPADQKNALQNDLKQALSSWYNQLPQDQQAKLQSIVNQTIQAQ
ncbi:MAG: hypothetical protein WCE82_07210 [Halobacteriota archaeon]